MRLLILVLAISRLCECSLPYYGVTVGLSSNARPVVSQYHRQDNYGQYVYGYATDLSSQDEVKTPDGVTRGGYSYIDANGILQTVQYISDPVNGFRVLATNIPRDVPEVAHARAAHLAQFEHIKAEHASIAHSRKYQPILNVSPASGSYVLPIKTHIAPPPAPASFQPIIVEEPTHGAPVQAVVPVQHAVAYTPAVTVSSQYHAQDSLGQYSYGYADPNSAKSETKTADGVTRGGYSYIDANGILQTVHYISDPVNGFRVSATNLPQAPSVTLIGPKVTTTVVGPKDTNTIAADTVISPVPLVPIHSAPTQHIDSFAIEQKPVLTQVDIVQHANVAVASPQGPYIHSNPNHETPVVYTNPELTAPFHVPHSPAHINPEVYNAPPIPVTHSQSVLYNKEPVYTAPSALENHSYNPELSHHVDQSVVPHQQAYPHSQHEQQIILSEEHVPSRVPLGPHHPHNQIYVQSNHPQPQQVIIAPDEHTQAHLNHRNEYISVPQEHRPQSYEQVYVQPNHPQHAFVAPDAHNNQEYAQNYQHQQIVPSEHNHGNQQIYITPEGHVSNGGNENQQIYLLPGGKGHENQQVLLSSGEHQDQIYADPNHVHASHPIQLGPEQRANYYAADNAVPINAEAINNGPTNQQVLNHGGAHSQLTFQPRNSAAYGNSPAYEGAYTYGENPAYVKQISAEERTVFVPNGSAAPEVQQVYQHPAPVDHGPQVAPNHEQHAFLLQREEHDQPSAHEAQHATSPSGYYTQNIQY